MKEINLAYSDLTKAVYVTYGKTKTNVTDNFIWFVTERWRDKSEIVEVADRTFRITVEEIK